MLPNWLYGKSKSKLASILGGGGGAPADYNRVKAQVNQNTEDILLLSDGLDGKAALTQISNPNLLDNPWFTINQRNFATVTGKVKYTVDRWKLNTSVGTVTANVDNTITLEKAIGEGPQFIQYVAPELSKALDGKTVTLSAVVDGVVYSDTFVYENEDNFIKQIPLKDEWILDYRCLGSNENQHFIRFLTNGTTLASSITIRAVKLELGSVSTLAMDTAPDYTTELLKCQRYFYKTLQFDDNGANVSPNQCLAVSATRLQGIKFPVQMRANPTVTVNEVNELGSSTAITGVTSEWTSKEGISYFTIAGATVGNLYIVDFEASAEL